MHVLKNKTKKQTKQNKNKIKTVICNKNATKP